MPPLKPQVITPFLGDTTFERLTLLRIKDTITPRTRILYMHSKGVRHSPKDGAIIQHWRVMMEYFLVRHWRTCQCLLQLYDTVGICLRTNPPDIAWPTHYSGNFWWTTGAWWLGLREVRSLASCWQQSIHQSGCPLQQLT